MLDAFTEYRFVACSAPVGSGKTVSYIAVALAMGWRVCVVTSTKGLQDQLLRDFAAIGLVDVRGRNNYSCGLGYGGAITCEDGYHMGCVFHEMDDCLYREDVKTAWKSKLVTTNYKYWMLSHLYGDGLGKFDLVVFDEAHEAPEEVCSVMAVQVAARDIDRLLNARLPDNPLGATIDQWAAWAKHLLPKVLAHLDAAKRTAGGPVAVGIHEARNMAKWISLKSTLTILSKAQGPWASEQVKNYRDGICVRLEPLWPKHDAQELLFLGVPHVLLASATMTIKTTDLLGIPRDQLDFQEYPYLFPIRRSPVYHIPTCHVQWDMSEGDCVLLESRVDQIVGRRLDRKGLIHTHSYHLRDQLKKQCQFNDYFLVHERGNSQSTRDTVARFRLELPPVVLVSPSVGTGYDFPYRDAEYQIIPKLPFPVIKGSPIMEARCHKRKGGDPTYGNYLMVQSLCQMIGRPMRAPDDRCETFILDNNWFWVRAALRTYFPRWVFPLLRKAEFPPDPPPPLELVIQ